VIRAVVFDLWDTLVDFDPVGGRAFQDQVAARLGQDPEEFAAIWLDGRAKRESGSLSEYLRSIGANDGGADDIVVRRRASTRPRLVPRPGAVETFRELHEAGLSDRKLTTTLQQSAHDLLLDGRSSR